MCHGTDFPLTDPIYIIGQMLGGHGLEIFGGGGLKKDGQ